MGRNQRSGAYDAAHAVHGGRCAAVGIRSTITATGGRWRQVFSSIGAPHHETGRLSNALCLAAWRCDLVLACAIFLCACPGTSLVACGGTRLLPDHRWRVLVGGAEKQPTKYPVGTVGDTVDPGSHGLSRRYPHLRSRAFVR